MYWNLLLQSVNFRELERRGEKRGGERSRRREEKRKGEKRRGGEGRKEEERGGKLTHGGNPVSSPLFKDLTLPSMLYALFNINLKLTLKVKRRKSLG